MTKIRQKSPYEKTGAETTTYPAQMDNNDYGKKRKAKTHTLVIKNSLTGQVFGYKTIPEGFTFSEFLVSESIQSKWAVEYADGTKETVVAIDRQHVAVNVKHPEKTIKSIKRIKIGVDSINEAKEDSRLPGSVIAQIKSLIRKGAKDLTQAWKHAYELVRTAYHVAHVAMPTPDRKGAWDQYTELLKDGVRALADAHGTGNSKWRVTTPVYNEDTSEVVAFDNMLTEALGKRRPRIFARVKTHGYDDQEQEFELDASDMDEVVQTYLTRAKHKGLHVRIEPLAKNEMKLTIYKKGVNKTRDEMVVRLKDISMAV